MMPAKTHKRGHSEATTPAPATKNKKRPKPPSASHDGGRTFLEGEEVKVGFLVLGGGRNEGCPCSFQIWSKMLTVNFRLQMVMSQKREAEQMRRRLNGRIAKLRIPRTK